MKKLFLALFLSLSSATSFAIDPTQVEAELNGTGAVGWVHGSVEGRDLFVFTYRNPADFFDYLNFSLVPADELVRVQLKALKRHDRVRIKGSYLSNQSPQKHIEVTFVEVIKKYEPSEAAGDYVHEAKIPDELMAVDHAQFLVHAIAGNGHILVVEFKDGVLPIHVKNAALTKNLYRNDVVELKYTIQAFPDRPTHLRLKEREPDALRVLDSIRNLHGQVADLEGKLVMFPKSPDVIFNVFAIQQELPGGLKRHFTLVNFENSDEFARIRIALQEAWDRHPGEFVNGRGKLVSKRIRVRAKGHFNEVDANQANPQILLPNVGSISISEN